MKKILFPFCFSVLLLLIVIPSANAQKFTISGYVKDASSGEFLIGSNVYLKELMKGVSTNTYGFFSITVEKGDYDLITSFVGYKD